MIDLAKLIQVPYLMRPGLSKLEIEPYELFSLAAPEVVKTRTALRHHFGGNLAFSEVLKLMVLKIVDPREDMLTLDEFTRRHNEDIIVINSRGELELLYVLSPSGWAPEYHLGRTFFEIHNRLPDADSIKAASDAIVKMITSGGSYRRMVWTLSPVIDQSRHPGLANMQANWDITKDIFLRWETQTIVPLEPGGKAIFVIKVETALLSDVCKEAKDYELILSSLASMSPEVLAYKGLNNPRVQEIIQNLLEFYK
jgi:hypothetical protein